MNPTLASLKRLSHAVRGAPKPLRGAPIKRKETCSFCGNTQAFQIGRVEYWDLAECDVVQCANCRQMQFDPMLTSEQMEKGCIAFDSFQRKIKGREWYIRNNRRHFRHGFRFGTRLERLGIHPRTILEIGPGGGYFSRGIQQVHPDAKVTVVDIVDEVLRENREEHGHATYQAFPEEIAEKVSEKYDLIVGRDILEHVADPFLVLKNCEAAMNPGGYLYILTPNGYEDIWRIHMNWQFEKRPLSLLINHVNYFDAASLVKSME